ncbi:MAG TPA: OmpA family protein [Candidatus Dormibacteraeota bacterium]|nr:OmpA family protein [Candidatus Dormibacteraeota bacterium]
MKKLFLAIAFFAVAAFVSAQTQTAAPSSTTTTSTVTTTTVATTSTSALASAPAPAPTVSRTIKAMHYRLQGGQARIEFHGGDLMQRASGEAKVEGKKTNFEIDAKFQGFDDATKFGLEYLTYVLWAISPQGRPVNLGELNLDHHGNAQVKAYTDLQTFGMIVTAEPYFAVTQPGNMVIAESNSISGAATENIDAKYELVTRGTYSATNQHIQDAIFGIDSKTPLELFEARNAVRIAHIAGADKYAASILSKAGQQLLHAEELYRQKQKKETVGIAAKEATETAEEARLMAVKQKAEEEAQAAAAAREAKARADAAAEAQRRADAEAARAAADKARIQAEQDRAAAEQAKAEAERMKQEAQAAAQEAARQKEEAEKAKAEAVAQQQALAAETVQARAAAAQSENLRQQAEREKQELRERLLQQLNSILATRDSARGLVANMSDVLFRSGSYELAPGARERLAKVSGIILAYPSLHVSVEGHTDSVGSDEYNQSLSELRAQAVRDYFVQQGISSGTIEFHGYGKTAPIASNDTPEGRQQNRRVELVLSGDAIGNTFDAAPKAPATSASATPRQ